MGPDKLLELSGSYWMTFTLHAAVKLNLFSLLGRERLTAADLAAKTATCPDALLRLLNALAAMAILAKEGDAFQNTPASLRFLCKDSPDYIGFIIMHHHHLADSWLRLDEAVKTGGPVRGRVAFSDDQQRESFLMGMFNLAMGIAPGVADQLDLFSRRRLLDLGGGPGTYAIHFCLKNPGLEAVVYDLPTTRPFAEKTAARFGMESRVSFQGGDYLTDVISGTFDAAWLSHILHAEGPEGCRRILAKTAAALESGGAVYIHEFILDNTQDRPLFPALFSLNMLLGTEAGRSYSEREIIDLLDEAGFTDLERIPFQGPSDSGIIKGLKP